MASNLQMRMQGSLLEILMEMNEMSGMSRICRVECEKARIFQWTEPMGQASVWLSTHCPEGEVLFQTYSFPLPSKCRLSRAWILQGIIRRRLLYMKEPTYERHSGSYLEREMLVVHLRKNTGSTPRDITCAHVLCVRHDVAGAHHDRIRKITF